MSSANCKTILIAPLDWGLGHTTRCVPLIGYMQQQAHHIIFAGNEWQQAFIDKTFPGIETIHLEGYNVNYGKSGRNFRLSIFAQIPHLVKAIRKEQQWLHERLEARKIDAIISDNRYGLWHPTVPSVIMTHQLRVITGFGAGADNVFQKLHYKFLNRFRECWVVDNKENGSLAGRLSQPRVLPHKTSYIGLLSQFAGMNTQGGVAPYLLVLLSGPEPQRTILSKLLWEQVLNYKGKVVFVEGNNAADTPQAIPNHITYHKQLTRASLLPLLQQAEMVICRSGYSTLMDLIALHKKALIIPTPGQTEQEYLAKYLHDKKIFYAVSQAQVDLNKDTESAKVLMPIVTNEVFCAYRPILDKFLSGSKSRTH